MPSILPGLWVIATPLGNPSDLSPNAINCLCSADLVLAEDTRRALWLFRRLDIKVKSLQSFHDHSEMSRLPEILSQLQEGKKIALISDAGTPLLSDPGYRLVRACRQNNVPVHPVPGPSAPVAALSAAGLPPIPFSFLGFLPRHNSARERIFRQFRTVPGSLVFFERKDRLNDSLKVALAVLGDREIAICRELTKTHETFIIGKLAAILPELGELQGEITVIIGPAQQAEKTQIDEVENLLRQELAHGLKLRNVVGNVLQNCNGWSNAELYDLARRLRDSTKD